jgi:hypothetical protein
MRKLNWIRVADAIILAIMFAAFWYGIFRFPDGPLHPCETGYCGKQGQPHTATEYRDYLYWSILMLIVWPAGLVGFGLIEWINQRNRN